MNTASYVAIGASGLAAGAINALAGGGTLITFPTFVACGLPPLVANITSTVALCPGFAGAAITQRHDLQKQRRAALVLVPIAALGGFVGAMSLRFTSKELFAHLAPWLVLLAVVLLAVGPIIKRRVTALSAKASDDRHVVASIVTLAVAWYGGFFGAGMGVMLIATLGLLLSAPLIEVTALKQLLALVINAAAALYLVFLTPAELSVEWPVALVAGIAAIIGGAIGAAIGNRVPEAVLRWLVVTIGLAFAGYAAASVYL